MKRLLTLVVCCISFISCSTPQSVAEKALDLVGLGTFYGSFNNEEIFIFSKYGHLFDNCLIKNAQVEFLRNNGSMSNSIKDEQYFQVKTMFNTYELVSCDKYEMSLYNYINCSPKRELDNLIRYSGEGVKYTIDDAIKICKNIKDAILELHSDFIEIDEYLTYLEYKDIPFYELKYKIDNQSIAHMYILKIPEKGYRVCRLWFE